jgi:hypothetical protein
VTPDLQELTLKFLKNRAALVAQSQCSCDCCESIIDSDKVVSVVDGGMTGVFPE